MPGTDPLHAPALSLEAMASANNAAVAAARVGGGGLVVSIDHALGCLQGAAHPRRDGVGLGV